VYIGVYDWGKIKHLQEVMPSLYRFTNEQDATSVKEVCRWVSSKKKLFIKNQLQIPFDEWLSNIKQL